MTRKEEIAEKAREMYRAGVQNSLQFRAGFCTGAEWADKTMIEKACNYLLNYIKDFDFYTESDVEIFRKAMEE